MTRFLRLLALAGVVVAVLVPVAGAGDLNTRALRKLFPGDFHAVVRGSTVQFTAKSDGSLIGRYLTATDQGRWSVRNGRLCIVLEKWMKGKAACSTVTEDDGWYRAADVRFRRI
jgi:hypothetical protein